MGTTTISNTELMDYTNNAQGVLHRLWTDPNGIFKSVYRINGSDCMDFVNVLVKPDEDGSTPLGPSINNYASFQPYMDQYTHDDAGWKHGFIRGRRTGLMYRVHTVHTLVSDDAWALFLIDMNDPTKPAKRDTSTPGIKPLPLDKPQTITPSLGLGYLSNIALEDGGSSVQEVTKL